GGDPADRAVAGEQDVVIGRSLPVLDHPDDGEPPRLGRDDLDLTADGYVEAVERARRYGDLPIGARPASLDKREPAVERRVGSIPLDEGERTEPARRAHRRARLDDGEQLRARWQDIADAEDRIVGIVAERLSGHRVSVDFVVREALRVLDERVIRR